MHRVAVVLAACLGLLGTGSVTAAPPPVVVAPDGTFASTLDVSVTNTTNRFARAWCVGPYTVVVVGETVERYGVIYEEFVEVVDGVATFTLGPTPRWVEADQAEECEAESGRLVKGRWRADASDGFSVSGGVTFAAAVTSGSLALNESGPFAIDDTVTFTWSADLTGSSWPMIHLTCVSVVDGGVLYGQLDHPDTVFVLGGGSSPWRTAENTGEDAECRAELRAFRKSKPSVLLATTESFHASG